jgi:hypothetical protein
MVFRRRYRRYAYRSTVLREEWIIGLHNYTLDAASGRTTMTYRDALWTAIIGEADKFGHRITRAKKKKYLQLVECWRKAQ